MFALIKALLVVSFITFLVYFQIIFQCIQFAHIAQWASYVVGGITHLKVEKLLDFAKSQISEEN